MEDHPEQKPVFREEVAERVKQPRVTYPYYTKYEYTALLAMRAQQLAEGAVPMIDIQGMTTSDPLFVWNVAKREIENGKLPYVIRRQLPDGNAEFWDAQELKVMW